MRPDDSLEERPKHVVTSKLHCVNKIIYSQVVLDFISPFKETIQYDILYSSLE